MKEAELLKLLSMSRKERILSQLNRLAHLQERKVIKFHEIAQMQELKRELAEIEFSEKNKGI